MIQEPVRVEQANCDYTLLPHCCSTPTLIHRVSFDHLGRRTEPVLLISRQRQREKHDLNMAQPVSANELSLMHPYGHEQLPGNRSNNGRIFAPQTYFRFPLPVFFHKTTTSCACMLCSLEKTSPQTLEACSDYELSDR
jgi:hypothetical protein